MWSRDWLRDPIQLKSDDDFIASVKDLACPPHAWAQLPLRLSPAVVWEEGP